MGDESRLTPAEEAAPYSALAESYDFVMSHVNYRMWAEYVHELISRHHSEALELVELGCGTGSLAILLQPMGGYSYLATDGSQAMLDVARAKAEEAAVAIQFKRADFTAFRVDENVDAIILLYDGLNYLLEGDDVRRLLRCAYEALVDGGIFIVDQSTPANSVNNEAFFESSDSRGAFSYVRRSRYEAASRLHRTTLEMSIGERTVREEHVQRAYGVAEARALMEAAGFAVEAVYDGFSRFPGSEESERVHWVLRRPIK